MSKSVALLHTASLAVTAWTRIRAEDNAGGKSVTMLYRGILEYALDTVAVREDERRDGETEIRFTKKIIGSDETISLTLSVTVLGLLLSSSGSSGSSVRS